MLRMSPIKFGYVFIFRKSRYTRRMSIIAPHA
jgi:hypothetical protein